MILWDMIHVYKEVNGCLKNLHAEAEVNKQPLYPTTDINQVKKVIYAYFQ